MGDVNSQFAKVTCNDERVFVEKYRIKLSRTIKGKSVKVIFSSFLFEGYWGLTNIKAISGCGAYAGLDSLTSTCSLCSSGSFYL